MCHRVDFLNIFGGHKKAITQLGYSYIPCIWYNIVVGYSNIVFLDMRRLCTC